MERNVPKLRFNGFNDDWKSIKGNNIFDVIGGAAFSSKYSSTKGVKWFKIANVGINKTENKEISFLPKEIEKEYNKYVLNVGDIVIALTRPILNSKLKICVIDNFFKGALLNQRVGRIVEKNNMNKKFIYYLIQNEKSIRYLENMIAGTDPPNLSNGDLLNQLYIIPSLQEQERIANFLTKVDKIIEKQEEKVKNLEKYKKGMMQKIFSQEIRFKDENGEDYPEWEEKKIEKCFAERSERGFEELELLSVSINGGVSSRSEIDAKDNSSNDKSNYKLVEENDIVYNSMRMWQGASGRAKKRGIVSPAYTVIVPQEGINSWYFSYLFKLDRTVYEFKKYSQGLTSDTWNLKYPQLKDIKVNVPCLEEQEKIVRILTNIDSVTDKEKEKLEELKQWKKGLLQQMFV